MLDIADQYTLSLKMRDILSSVYKLSTHRVEWQDPSASQYSLQMAQQVNNVYLLLLSIYKVYLINTTVLGYTILSTCTW